MVTINPNHCISPGPVSDHQDAEGIQPPRPPPPPPQNTPEGDAYDFRVDGGVTNGDVEGINTRGPRKPKPKPVLPPIPEHYSLSDMIVDEGYESGSAEEDIDSRGPANPSWRPKRDPTRPRTQRGTATGPELFYDEQDKFSLVSPNAPADGIPFYPGQPRPDPAPRSAAPHPRPPTKPRPDVPEPTVCSEIVTKE